MRPVLPFGGSGGCRLTARLAGSCGFGSLGAFDGHRCLRWPDRGGPARAAAPVRL